MAMQRRDRLIPWYFVTFFAVIVLADGLMVTLAVRSNTGLVVDHAYERGLAYNKVVEAYKKQEAMQWAEHFSVDGENIRFSLSDAAGMPVLLDAVFGKFTRPDRDDWDRSAEFRRVGDVWQADTASLPSGVWNLRIYASQKDNEFQSSHRIVQP